MAGTNRGKMVFLPGAKHVPRRYLAFAFVGGMLTGIIFALVLGGFITSEAFSDWDKKANQQMFQNDMQRSLYDYCTTTDLQKQANIRTSVLAASPGKVQKLPEEMQRSVEGVRSNLGQQACG